MKWFCYGSVVGTKFLGTVEADTEKQARSLAAHLPTAYVSVCHQCARQISDPEIDSITVEPEE